MSEQDLSLLPVGQDQLDRIKAELEAVPTDHSFAVFNFAVDPQHIIGAIAVNVKTAGKVDWKVVAGSTFTYRGKLEEVRLGVQVSW